LIRIFLIETKKTVKRWMGRREQTKWRRRRRQQQLGRRRRRGDEWAAPEMRRRRELRFYREFY